MYTRRVAIIVLVAGIAVMISTASVRSATITVDADTARNFNGRGQVTRQTFGVQPWASAGKHMLDSWNADSNGLGRNFVTFMPDDGELPGMSGLTLAQQRALIFSPSYWSGVDLSTVTASWTLVKNMVNVNPSPTIFMELWCRDYQFPGVPVFGVVPPALTAAQQALIAGTYWDTSGTIAGIVSAASPDDNSPSLNTDEAMYVEIIANVVAKIKTLLPNARILITFGNENDNINMLVDQTIMNDFFNSMSTYKDYSSGVTEANEYLAMYNLLYNRIKPSYPDVLIGGPDVLLGDSNQFFADVNAGRSIWNNFIVPIINSAAGMDFFDYHYGIDPQTAETILETVNQYAQQSRGWSGLPSVDSEAGTWTFNQDPDPSYQFSCGLINEREWFTRLGVPDLEFGWAAIDLPSYYDGFGSANGVGMPLLMFRTLQGQFVQASSNTTGIDTVASISGNRVTSVTLNDNTSTQSVTIDLHAPSGTTFTEIDARVLWLNSVTDEIQYATFQPIVTQGPDGLVVNIESALEGHLHPRLLS